MTITARIIISMSSMYFALAIIAVRNIATLASDLIVFFIFIEVFFTNETFSWNKRLKIESCEEFPSHSPPSHILLPLRNNLPWVIEITKWLSYYPYSLHFPEIRKSIIRLVYILVNDRVHKVLHWRFSVFVNQPHCSYALFYLRMCIASQSYGPQPPNLSQKRSNIRSYKSCI